MKSLIPSSWAVPTRFRTRLGEAAGRQRAMAEGGHLLLVLHAVPVAGDAEREARLFWRDEKGNWRSSNRGGGAGALQQHLKDFEDAVAAQEGKLSVADQAEEYFEVLRASTPLLRTSHHLHRVLQEAREACEDRELINLRDRAGEVERAAELLVSESRDALEFTTARRAEEQAALSLKLSQQSNRLNVIAAVFLPITALASIFSMTLKNGLETTGAPYAFWAIVAAGVGVGVWMRQRYHSI